MSAIDHKKFYMTDIACLPLPPTPLASSDIKSGLLTFTYKKKTPNIWPKKALPRQSYTTKNHFILCWAELNRVLVECVRGQFVFLKIKKLSIHPSSHSPESGWKWCVMLGIVVLVSRFILATICFPLSPSLSEILLS